MQILVVGPHPDDQELGMGGTIAALASAGHDVLLLDMSDGEPTPYGDPETRAREAAQAAKILGVQRKPMGLMNRQIEYTLQARHQVAGAIREHRAEIIFLPYFEDAHPDHIATTRIVEDARFDAKLTKIDLPGEPIYPRRLIYYFCTHLKIIPRPTFLLDISGFESVKRQAIEAYESQFIKPEKNQGIADWIADGNRYFGSRIGVTAAEPFFMREELGIAQIESLL